MLKNITVILLAGFLFTACSNKQNIEQTNKKQVVKKQINEFDEFSDFEDEFTKKDIKKEDFDPLEGYNRVMTNFNDKLIIYILSPTSKAYAYVVPKAARVGISNAFDNIKYPIRFVNNLLQLKFANAAEETGRFLINSTLGVFGLWDPAKKYFNLEKKDEDFGQTLGYWGVGEGFHVVLPFFGPSNLRDIAGLSADTYLSVTSTIIGEKDIKYKLKTTTGKSVAITAIETVNEASLRIGQYENLKKDAVDLYPFLKEIYNQRRNKLIKE